MASCTLTSFCSYPQSQISSSGLAVPQGMRHPQDLLGATGFVLTRIG